jgi:hypothetical protein
MLYVRNSGEVITVHSTKSYRGMEVQLHSFLTSVLYRGEWWASRPGRFNRRERAPWYHLNGQLVGPTSRYRPSGKKNYIYIYSPCWESNQSSSAVKTVRYSRTESHEMEGNVSKVLRQSYILHHKLHPRYKINTFFHKATRSFRSVRISRNIKMLRNKEVIIQTHSTAHSATLNDEPVAPTSCVLQLTVSKVPKH